MTPSKDETVEVDGAGLAVREAGAGPSALLIHGTAAAVWGETFDGLAEDHRVIAYDRRSFGASTHPPLADTSRHAADAAGLLRANGAAPAIVVGWSVGGVIALELAATEPELVRGVVLIEPPFLAKRHPNPRLIWALAGVKPVQRLRGDRAAARRFLRWAMRERSGASGFDRLDPATQEAMLANAAAIVRELDAGTGEHIDRDRLRSIACPAVCLLGDRSNATFAAAARRVVRDLRACDLRDVTGAGHMMQLDRPDTVIQAVRDIAPRATP